MAIKHVGKKPLDLDAALKGYAMNKMCHSFLKEENRAAFRSDEDAYMAKYGLSDEERAAIKRRDKQALFAIGLNMYFYPKLMSASQSTAAH